MSNVSASDMVSVAVNLAGNLISNGFHWLFNDKYYQGGRYDR